MPVVVDDDVVVVVVVVAVVIVVVVVAVVVFVVFSLGNEISVTGTENHKQKTMKSGSGSRI